MNRIVTKAIAAIMIMMSAVVPDAAAQKKAIQVGDSLPGFFLKDLKGDSFFLKDHVGVEAKNDHRAVIFSLSASYCKPCRKEIPELERMAGKFADKGLAVFLVAIENRDNAGKLVRETQTKLPVLVDRYLVVPKMIGRESIPCTLLVDNDGVVRFINTGFNENNAEEFIARFEEAVAAVLDSDDNSGE